MIPRTDPRTAAIPQQGARHAWSVQRPRTDEVLAPGMGHVTQLSEMVDYRPDPEVDSAWLAAYALGLAYSSRSQEERVELLRDATDGRAELLAVAQQRLDLVAVVEPGLRAQARRLLECARR
jgi:hypothetical protein